MLKPLNQVLSSLVDQEAGQQIESDMNFEGSYPVEEYEVRIMEPERSGGPWQLRATIPMQSSENALTVRVVTLYVSLGSSCLSISVCIILLLYRYFIWSKVYICMYVYILCLCLVTEFYHKRKRNSFGNWDSLFTRRGCCCKGACAVVLS